MILDHASNWEIYALQTEEERGEGGFALPLDIRDSSDITLANLHMYRVVSSYQPFPYAVELLTRTIYGFATSIATAIAKCPSTTRFTTKPTTSSYANANSPG